METAGGVGGQGGAVVAAGLAVVVAVVLGLLGQGRNGKKSNTPAVALQGEGDTVTTYTLDELAKYDGVVNPGSPILIGVDGTVFDMTLGKDFYGPGGPYEAFAGRCVATNTHPCSPLALFASVPFPMCRRGAHSLAPVYRRFEGDDGRGAACRDATVALAKMKVDREFTNIPNGMASLSMSEKDILHDWKTVPPPTATLIRSPCHPTRTHAGLPSTRDPSGT
jgi:predicted heme/steroid binding protein